MGIHKGVGVVVGVEVKGGTEVGEGVGFEGGTGVGAEVGVGLLGIGVAVGSGVK